MSESWWTIDPATGVAVEVAPVAVIAERSAAGAEAERRENLLREAVARLRPLARAVETGDVPLGDLVQAIQFVTSREAIEAALISTDDGGS